MKEYIKTLIFGERKNEVKSGKKCSCKGDIFYNKDKLIKHQENVSEGDGFCKECDKKYSIMVTPSEVSVYNK